MLATLMKNCEPPVFFEPVFAMLSVPGAFVSREMFSSRMLPPLKRFSVSPVARFLNVPSEGPPVPAAWLFGSLAYGLSRANYMHSVAASQDCGRAVARRTSQIDS